MIRRLFSLVQFFQRNHLSLKRRTRIRQTIGTEAQLLERRINLSTFSADLNGAGPLEQVTVDFDLDQVTVVSGAVQSVYGIGGANSYQLADLDGMPGQEILFYISNGINQPAVPKHPVVVTYRTDTATRYESVGSANNVEIADLDGMPGDEVLFYTVGPHPIFDDGITRPNVGDRPANHPYVLTHRTESVSGYDVGGVDGVIVEDLNGYPGNEVLFYTSYEAMAYDFQLPFDVTAAVLTLDADPAVHQYGPVSVYDIGEAMHPGSLVWTDFVQVDGLPGSEVIFSLQDGTQRILFQRTRALHSAELLVVSNTHDSGFGSLRQAIIDANASTDETTFPLIVFDLPDGQTTIHVRSALPAITRRVTIIGSNGAGTPGVELSGEFAGSETNGLTITGDNVVVRGLAINRFSGSGILIDGGSSNLIAGNYIGTDLTGTRGLGNWHTGVTITGNASNNRIGTNGDGRNDANERNIISGNGWWGVLLDGAASSNYLTGNYIGTNVTGTEKIGNGWWGVNVNGKNNVIGGSSLSGLGNLVSGNNQGGITVTSRSATGNIVQGNYVGTTASGTSALGNAFSGILVADWGASGEGPKNTTVGGSALGLGNVVSGNGGGIWIDGSTTAGTVVVGNFVGTDATGSVAMGNASSGIEISGGAHDTRIGTNGDGTADDAERNLISGNGGNGIHIIGTGTSDTIIAGNYIGTNAAGTAAVGNANDGIWVSGGAHDTRIGTNGDGIADAAERNVISGNGWDGVAIEGVGTDNNVLAGNYIGTNAAASAAIPNVASGVAVYAGATRTRIGTDGSGANDIAERNVISGNSAGIFIGGSGTDRTVIAGNYVGTNGTGLVAIANSGDGIMVVGGATNTRIGTNGDGIADGSEQNVISGNSVSGIGVYDTGTSNTTIAGNYIGLAADGATRLANAGDAGIVVSWANATRIGTDGNGIADAAERNVISGNTQEGIQIQGATASDTVVAGNFIGTSASGLTGVGNGYDGIFIWGSAHDTRIGTNGDGTADVDERNVVSGNGGEGIGINSVGADNNVVAGNYIGTDAFGLTAIPNVYYGVAVWNGATNTRIGTDGSDDSFNENERNVISGNGFDGIYVADSTTTGTVIAGNYIGTDAVGTARLGNVRHGINLLNGTHDNRIGTNGDGVSDSVERNVVSGNGSYGILIQNAGTDNNRIAGNYVGTDSNGTSAIGNLAGIVVVGTAKNTVIGTNGDSVSDAIEGNLLSGNSYYGLGVYGGADRTVIAGNSIGITAIGSKMPNGYYGIYVDGGTTSTRIGPVSFNKNEQNLIAWNGIAGLYMGAVDASTASVRFNSFRGNGLAIDISAATFTPDGATPNDPGDTDGVKNAPVITSAIVAGELLVVEGFARSGTQFDLYETSHYANGFGQGDRYLVTLKENSANDLDSTTGAYGPLVNGITVGTDIANRFKFEIPLASLPSDFKFDGFITAINVAPISEFSAIAGVVRVSVSHAPTGASKTITTLEDSAYHFTLSDFGFSDPNDSPANSLLAVKMTTLPAAGTLTDNGTAVVAGQFVSADDINSGKLIFTPSANANGSGFASFQFQVEDDGSTAYRGSILDPNAKTITFNVTPVNDAPVGSPKTVTTLEDTPYVFASADFGFTDPNDTPANALMEVKITTLPSAGTLTNNGTVILAGTSVSAADIAAGRFTFTPGANGSGAAYTSFTFQVQDNGGKSNGGVNTDPVARTLTVDVTMVLDAPTDITLSSANIAENNLANAVIGTLSVTHEEPSNTFTFSLISGDGSTDNGSFTIVGNTLKLSPVANFENQDSYSILVEVADENDQKISKQFIINVTDVNEFDPVLANATFTIAENSANGTGIGTVTAIDADSTKAISYSITAGNDLGIFGIHPTTGAITVVDKTKLDRETVSSIALTVQVSDGGPGTARTGMGLVTINVADVNEFDPVLTNATFAIAENSANGTAVGAVTAIDADSTKAISYSITAGNDLGIFGIHPTTGAITVVDKTKLDRETVSSIALTVQVSDGGPGTARTGTGPVTINVTNVNEVPFDISLPSTSFPENMLVHSVVGTLTTSDPDFGDTFAYALVSGVGSTDNGSFMIVNGQLLTASDFDTETNNTYSILVQTTDRDGLTFEKQFTLTIADVNEHPTISSLPNQTVPYNSATGVLLVTVSDPEMPAGNLTVSASSSNLSLIPNANILIGGTGATRSLVVTPAASHSGTATITLTVSDGILTSSQTFQIAVQDDAPPVITLSSQTLKAGKQAVALDSSATITDTDTPVLQFDGAVLTVSGAATKDTISILQRGGIARKGKKVMMGKTVIGTIIGGKQGQSLTVHLSGGTTQSAVQLLLRAIGLKSTDKVPSDRTFKMQITQIAGVNSNQATRNVHVGK